MNLNRDLRGVSLYPVCLGGLLAIGWLLPNHYAPWYGFHTNAWTAGVLLLIAFWALATQRAPLHVSRVGVALLAISVIPWLQHAMGLVPLRSDALLSGMYLLGVGAAFILGEHWARLRPGAPVAMVLVAASIAACVSVCLQIYQWFGLALNPDWLHFWIFPSGASRPYGNMGQPNQLASLQLWGVLGVAWAWHKRWLPAAAAIAAAAFIVLGAALTESRTAALTLTAGTLYLSLRRPAWVEKKAVRAAQGLYLFYLAVLAGIEPLSRLVGQDSTLTVFARSAGETRGTIWRMILDAASTRPWLGFGWNHTNEAFLSVFPRHPALANLYLEQSHNIVLDLIVWVGIPLAAVLVLATLWWLVKVVRATADMEQMLAVGGLIVMLVHAMLELPLHYGYFLWPFALIAGAATARVGFRSAAIVPRSAAAAGTLAFSLVAAAIIHDYFLVEFSFNELRFQLKHIGRQHDESRPNVVLLDDWADFIAMTRGAPKAGMTPAEIEHWRDLLIYNTSPLAFREVIGAYALNGQPEQAHYWGVRSCAVLVEAQCKAAQVEWEKARPSTAP